MTLILSPEIHTAYADQPDQLDRVNAITRIVFDQIPQLSLGHSHRQLVRDIRHITHWTDLILEYLRAEPPQIDIHARDAQTGETILHKLARSEFPPVSLMDALLQAGADPYAQRFDTGDTPLHIALHTTMLPTYRFRSDPDYIDSYYGTQLYHPKNYQARPHNRFELGGRKTLATGAELLLGYGVNIHERQSDTMSPLMLAQVPAMENDLREVLHHYDTQARALYLSILSGSCQSLSAHDALVLANGGLLERALHAPTWPLAPVQTRLMLDQLPPYLQQSLMGAWTAIALRNAPTNQLTSQLNWQGVIDEPSEKQELSRGNAR